MSDAAYALDRANQQRAELRARDWMPNPVIPTTTEQEESTE